MPRSAIEDARFAFLATSSALSFFFPSPLFPLVRPHGHALALVHECPQKPRIKYNVCDNECDIGLLSGRWHGRIDAKVQPGNGPITGSRAGAPRASTHRSDSTEMYQCDVSRSSEEQATSTGVTTGNGVARAHGARRGKLSRKSFLSSGPTLPRRSYHPCERLTIGYRDAPGRHAGDETTPPPRVSRASRSVRSPKSEPRVLTGYCVSGRRVVPSPVPPPLLPEETRPPVERNENKPRRRWRRPPVSRRRVNEGRKKGKRKGKRASNGSEEERRKRERERNAPPCFSADTRIPFLHGH